MGLKVPYKRKRRQKTSSIGGIGKMSPLYPNVVWAMDFQFDQTTDARPIKLLNIIDEYDRNCLAIEVSRSMGAADVVAILDNIVAQPGLPKYIRCDNGPEFISNAVAEWADSCEAGIIFIDPGSPWQNGKVESFNGRLRDEFLNGQLFESIKEAKVLLQLWKDQYNSIRPHSSLKYLTPLEFAKLSIKDQRLTLS